MLRLLQPQVCALANMGPRRSQPGRRRLALLAEPKAPRGVSQATRWRGPGEGTALIAEG